MSRLVATSNTGEMFLVSDEDYLAVVNEGGWFTTKAGYVAHDYRDKGTKKRVYLHQFIGKLMGYKVPMDHKNLDRLDNSRENLRPATKSQNAMNRGATKANKLQEKGVHWSEERKKYVAVIGVNSKQIPLGRFETLEEAKQAYREASEKYHGSHGRTE